MSNEISIISDALRNNQIRVQSQLSDLHESQINAHLKFKSDIVELQAHELRLRDKLSERVDSSIKNVSESLNKRVDFVTEGIRKAIELTAIKDKS